MAAARQVRILATEGTTSGFVALVGLVKAREPDPDAVSTWRAVCEDPTEAPTLFRLLEASEALTLSAYSLEGPPPADYRSRMVVQDILYALGKARHPPAFDVLAHIWRAHDVRELRIHAAHGLIAWNEPRALEVVAARLDDASNVELFLVMRASFRIGADSAWDRLGIAGRLEPEPDERVLGQALSYLIKTPKDATDPRFIEMAVALTRKGAGASSELRRLARDWLETQDQEAVAGARQRPKRPRRPHVDPTGREAALSRARAEVAPFRDALTTLTTVAPPDRAALDALERKLGLFPAAVRAWYELIGCVDLRSRVARPGEALVVVSLADLAADAEDEPDVDSQDPDEVIPFVLRLIPEPLTKAGFSAGPGYGVAVASPGTSPPDDPVLIDDPEGQTFLAHVRACLARTQPGPD